MMPRADRLAITIALCALPMRLGLAACTQLSPDEAYYVCAARLGATIPDHPPLIVWLLRASLALPSAIPIELRVRLWPLLIGTAIPLILIRLVACNSEPPAQRWTAVLASWLPLPLAGGFLATPDALAALAVAILMLGEQLPRSLRANVLASAATLVGSLGKGIVVPAAAVFGATTTQGPWRRVSIALGLAAAIPLSMRPLVFQLEHVYRPPHWTLLGAALALTAAAVGQLALWNPITVAIGCRPRWMPAPTDRGLIVVLSALFFASALARATPPEPNWLAPAALALLPAAARGLSCAHRAARVACVALGPGLTLVMASHVLVPWMPLRWEVDPSARLHGWSGPDAPLRAVGVGGYGAAAEKCVYRRDCDEIDALLQLVR